MTERESKMLVATLLAAFPVETRNVPPEEILATAKVYANGLRDLDSAVASEAVDRLIKSAERLPTVAKIRAACVEIAHGRKRPGGDAWGEVMAAIRRYGNNRSPGVDFHFADPMVARAVSAMGWRELCLSENQVADRARFTDLYESLQDSERAGAQISSGAQSKALPLARPVAAIARTGETNLGDALKALTGAK